MLAGEAFSARQVEEIARAARGAGERSGLYFSVFVGRSEAEPSVYAERLLAALGERSADGVVLHVDPTARRVEIVTGRLAARRLDDSSCGLASLSMTSAFSGGDLTGGIITGLRMLGDSAVSVPAP